MLKNISIQYIIISWKEKNINILCILINIKFLENKAKGKVT